MNCEIRKTCGRMDRVVMTDAWPVRTVGQTKCTVAGTTHTSAAARLSQDCSL